MRNGLIQTARIGLTGAVASPCRLPKVEAALVGQSAATDTIDAAAAIAGEGLEDFNADIHASAEYRRAMVPVFTRRALQEALAR